MAEITGNILRFEKTSIHDGEGLRTVVFLKGCPLDCLWCSTPESRDMNVLRGHLKGRCVKCLACIAACPHGALCEQSGAVLHNAGVCKRCFACASVCPADAVKRYGYEMTVSEAVREIAKDEVFYFHSGGGVTVSGGEPLQQAEFVASVLKECQHLGIHCALESSFFGGWEQIELILPFVNLLYVDIKHPKNDAHMRLAGVPNHLILENIIKADHSSHQFDMVIRIPVVPGLNDSDDAMGEAGTFVRGLRKLKFAELLAYHRLGTETYRALGLEYPLPDITPPEDGYMADRASIMATASGKPVKINGMDF